MKIHDVVQGTTAWHKLRAGIPTASEFHRIITAKSGKPSESAPKYEHELLAERLMGHEIDSFTSAAMGRGNELEPRARSFYELTNDVDVIEIGFVTNDAETIGASPDGFVGDDGQLEIKCPEAGAHIAYLLNRPVDRTYYPQLQGQLWATGRQWVDILSYHPEMPPALIMVERDEEYIEKLANLVTAFSAHLEAQWLDLEKQLDRGKPEPQPEPTQDEWLGVSDKDLEVIFQGRSNQ